MRTNNRTLSAHTLNLVRAHYDDELSFGAAARELSDFYRERGEHELSEYVLAQLPENPCAMSTMDPNSLPDIARDMYEDLELAFGADDARCEGYRTRLAFYFNDFFERCKQEGLVRTYD